jgi:hypothetical protein
VSVFITDGDQRAALALVRALGREGIAVMMLVCVMSNNSSLYVVHSAFMQLLYPAASGCEIMIEISRLSDSVLIAISGTHCASFVVVYQW